MIFIIIIWLKNEPKKFFSFFSVPQIQYDPQHVAGKEISECQAGPTKKKCIKNFKVCVKVNDVNLLPSNQETKVMLKIKIDPRHADKPRLTFPSKSGEFQREFLFKRNRKSEECYTTDLYFWGG